MMSIRRLLNILLFILVIFCEVLFILVVDFTIYTNNHINIVRQVVQINGLPIEFDGFTILQISDLHGKQFGNSEKGLTGIINSLDYDAIAITGDSQDTGSKDFQPLLELIRGINRKTPIFYISGNTGPFDMNYNTTGSRYSLDMTDGKIQSAGITLENAGFTLLNWPQAIERGSARLWLATDFSVSQSILAVGQSQQKLRSTNSQNEKDILTSKIEYQEKLLKIYASFIPGDTLIGIFHIPLYYKTLEQPRDYLLMISSFPDIITVDKSDYLTWVQFIFLTIPFHGTTFSHPRRWSVVFCLGMVFNSLSAEVWVPAGVSHFWHFAFLIHLKLT
jgi:predicted phosphodiesterase